MKSIIAPLILTCVLFHESGAQATLSLQECYDRAQANYPAIRQRELIARTRTYSVENASKGSLPQLSLGGQATYQSEVTRIPVEMPGVEPLSKDQYRIFGEVSQTLYHGGLVAGRKQLEEVSADAEEQKHEVELYQLQDRINELFFGILLVQEQKAQSQLIRKDLETGLRKVEGAIANGTALRSAGDILKAELLRLDQRIVELESTDAAYRHILGLFVGSEVAEATVLIKPSFTTLPDIIDRPELRFFEAQKQVLTINETLLSAARRPCIDLFLQGGYGRPGLNMLKNEFDLYYIGGIRFSWLVSGYYTLAKEKQIADLRRQALDVQKETFLFNTKLTLTQHQAEITRLQRLIEVDDQIITLRTNVRQTAEVQLDQGVIASSDFIREVNAEDQAKQNRLLHETQLLLAQAKYHFTSGQ